MKYTIYITAIIVTNCIFICSSCSEPEELTPKTASVTTDYLVPTGTILTADGMNITKQLTNKID